MISQARTLFAAVDTAFTATVTALKPLESRVLGENGNQPIIDVRELADTGYALKEAEKMLADLEKRVRKFRTAVEHRTCALWAKLGDPEPVRTDHVTASPDVKMGKSIPNKNREPEKYAAFMRALGISDDAIANDTVRPHYPSVIAYCTEKVLRGEPLPEGLTGDEYPLYVMRYFPKKDVGILD